MEGLKLKHSLTRNLYDLLTRRGVPLIIGNPIGSAIWVGLKGEVPKMFEALDTNEGAIQVIREELSRIVREDQSEVKSKSVRSTIDMLHAIVEVTPPDGENKDG